MITYSLLIFQLITFNFGLMTEIIRFSLIFIYPLLGLNKIRISRKFQAKVISKYLEFVKILNFSSK